MDSKASATITFSEYTAVPSTTGEYTVTLTITAGHGTFTVTDSLSDLTKAKVFAKGETTPVFVRFSAVVHSAHSPETLRDPRGFATLWLNRPEKNNAFNAEMIRELRPLFRSRHFNLCCDETFDLGKGRNAAFAGTWPASNS